MRRTTMAVIAATCSGLLGLGLFAAPAASAYPPGKKEKTTLNKSEAGPGKKARASVKNAQPGCRAVFTLLNKKGKEIEKKKQEVASDGTAGRTLVMPNKPGTYTVVTIVKGKGCTTEDSSAKITVV